MLHAIPSGMFMLQSIGKNDSDLFFDKMLELSLVRLRKKNGGTIFPRNQTPSFKIKITFKPF